MPIVLKLYTHTGLCSGKPKLDMQPKDKWNMKQKTESCGTQSLRDLSTVQPDIYSKEKNWTQTFCHIV